MNISYFMDNDNLINNDDDYIYNTTYTENISDFWWRIMISTMLLVSVGCAAVKSGICCYNCQENRLTSPLTSSRGNDGLLNDYLDSHKYTMPQKTIRDTCAICIEPLQENDTLILLSCNHYYHYGCIKSWFNKELICPICRHRISID